MLPTGFIPQEDASRISLSAELPPGSTLEDSAGPPTARSAKIIGALPEVKSVFVLGGAKPTGAAEPRNSVVSVELVNKTERDLSQVELEGKIAGLFSSIPDVRIFYVNPRGERALQLSVLGTDPVALDKAVAKLETAMRGEPMLYNVTASTGLNRPEIRINPKFDRDDRTRH